MKIAVIPAKSRSTRLPGKNLAPLAGRPLVVWSIQAALDSALFDHVVVSTDDPRIAEVARNAGAEIPFTRAAALTADGIEVDAVARDTVAWYRDHTSTPTWVCTLQPTSPLRRAEHIAASWSLVVNDPTADAVVAVSPYDHPPQWALSDDTGRLVPVDPASCTTSRTHLPPRLHPNGFIYWQKGADVLAERGLYDGRTLAYHTPRDVALDIDEPEDLAFAEWLLAARQRIRFSPEFPFEVFKCNSRHGLCILKRCCSATQLPNRGQEDVTRRLRVPDGGLP